MALEAPNPYLLDAQFPFLYPPFAADFFSLARTHLFELMSIAYVGAVALFVIVFARLDMPRRFEWLLAITAMGGLGVFSFKTGNVAIAMNFVLLALALDAAMGSRRSLYLLPVAISFGALIKPQFALYLGLLPVLERSWRVAAIKMFTAGAVAVAVHAGYMMLRPGIWNDYVASVTRRTMSEQDFGWGSAELLIHLTGSTRAALAGFAVAIPAVAAVSYVAWKRTVSQGLAVPLVSLVCLTFVVLTFVNPRLPLYDLYAAGIALIVCCGIAAHPEGAWAMTAAMAINLVPWLIANFARSPESYPWWTRDFLITHLTGLALLLVSLSRTGLAPGNGRGHAW